MRTLKLSKFLWFLTDYFGLSPHFHAVPYIKAHAGTMGDLCSLPGRACFVKAKKGAKRDQQTWSETTCAVLNTVYPPTSSARERAVTHSC